MQQMLFALRQFVRRDEGQDLLEYGVLVTLIAVFAMAAVTNLGNIINNVFWQVIGSTSF